MKQWLWVVIFVSGLAAETSAPRKLHIFSGLFSNYADCFMGYNLIGWAAVPASTAILVNTGVDERINTAVSRSPLWPRSHDVFALRVGDFLPIVPHAVFFTYGYFWGSSELAAAGAAGVQAVGLNGATIVFLKWVSGRPRPQYDSNTGTTPRDKEFNLNVFEQAVDSGRYRWPSGHTSAMFAMVSSFYGFYPNKHWIAISGYPLASLMGFAMVNGNYHWLSDVTAGAIIGTIIGWTTGQNFRRMYNKSQETSSTLTRMKNLDWQVWPTFSAERSGVSIMAAF